MLKRILACSFILAVLPLLTSSIHNSTNSVPFQSVAFAGHVLTGGGAYCQCGCDHCICDPGESPMDCPRTNRVVVSDTDSAADHGTSPTGKTGHSGLDFGSSALMLAVALWLWARLRA
jgi:hypothetical protein